MCDKRSLGRTNKIVGLDFTKDELDKIHEDALLKTKLLSNNDQVNPFNSCRIYTGSFQNGYPSLSRGHGKSKIKLHIVSAFKSCNRFPRKDECVSHLCHRKSCIESTHLVIESLKINYQRIGCLCCFKDDQSRNWNLCWHDPRCLRSDTKNNEEFKPALI